MAVDRIVDELHCTGCGACESVCNRNAICMKEGYHHFIYPFIDHEKCNECSLCEKNCPVINKPHISGKTIESIYALRCSDKVREKSSSGGAFFEISKIIMSEEGIVFGVICDDDLNVRFTKNDSLDKVCACQGSKYVQATTDKIYRVVNDTIKEGKRIAFFGLPCHIAALRNIVGDQERVLFVDIICHGVPSQYLMKKYLEEFNKISKDISFRNKKHGWRSDCIDINFADNTTYSSSLDRGDPYEIGFQENIILRDACENCEFCESPRMGDITIGDFWGIGKYNIDDHKGTSVLIINNEKGLKVLEKLAPEWMEHIDIKIGELNNRVRSYYPHNKNKNIFYELLNNHSFSEAIKMTKNNQFDIAIVGIPTVENLGGALTYLSLWSYLTQEGFTCALIDRPKDCKHPACKIEKVYNKSPYPPEVLFNNISSRAELNALTDISDIFLVGSDQLFNINLLNNFSYYQTLDWVTDNKTKIAYAASFGKKEFLGTENERSYLAYYLKKFDRFSVREESAVELVKNNFGFDAEHVLDPIFLCNPTVFKEVASQHDNNYISKYIGAYILDPTEEKNILIDNISKKLNLPSFVYSEMFYDNESIKKKWTRDIEIGKIENRLFNILNCDFYITDSFHGMCLCILFEKKFIAILNEGRGSERFLSLADSIGLSNRILHNPSDIDYSLVFEDIDYKNIKKQLALKIEKSKAWLNNSILMKKNKSFSVEDILIEKFEKEVKDLNDKIAHLSKILDVDYYLCTEIDKYLKILNKEKKHLMIVITAKDTPGMAITKTIQGELCNLGVKSDLMKSHWCGYIFVLYAGICVYEKCEYNQSVSYINAINSLDISIESRPLNCGNNCSVKIDGVEYSVGKRGLNIVVYDLEYERVTDSVCFDTHTYLLKAYRKK